MKESELSGAEDGVTRVEGEFSGDPALSDAYCMVIVWSSRSRGPAYPILARDL